MSAVHDGMRAIHDGMIYAVHLDVCSKDLYEGISDRLKVKYLTDSLHTEKLEKVDGILFGHNRRHFISLPVKFNQSIKNVHFVVITGSSKTFICKEVLDSLKVTVPSTDCVQVQINNTVTSAYLPPIGSKYNDMNILGTEFLKTSDASLIVDYGTHKVSILFGHKQGEELEQMHVNNKIIDGSTNVIVDTNKKTVES